MDDLLDEFLAEANENLDNLDTDLVRLERNPDDRQLVAKIFRVIHTVKGGAGFLGLDRLGALAHACEAVLARVRDGEVKADGAMVSLVLEGLDHIKDLLTEVEAIRKEPPGEDGDLVARLQAFAAGQATRAVPKEDRRVPGGSTELDGSIEAARTDVAWALPDAAPTSNLPAPVREEAPAAESEHAGHGGHSIRVDVDVLDSLFTNVGELVLARNQLAQSLPGFEDGAAASVFRRLNAVTAALRDGILAARMQPVRNAWSRLPRQVRDLGRDLGKRIELRTDGGDTELDRELLERIRDPLTHMVRNAADHGIEAPAERRAAGKPETGTISVTARHQAGYVVIEVADDGRGIDVEAVGRRAVAQGLVSAAALSEMPDERICEFIFAPGFSTAATVTNVSGRGVGMDVVRANIEDLGGSIALHAARGSGSTFVMRLPLTLAIIAALLVEAGGQRFAVPRLNVEELVRASATGDPGVETINGAPLLRLRGVHLPLLRLTDVLALAPAQARDEFLRIAVVQAGGRRFGLIVDAVGDTEEIVVKPVPPIIREVGLYAGTTILGDSSVAMILDPNRLAATLSATAVAEPESRSRELVKVPEPAAAFLLVRIDDRQWAAVPVASVVKLVEVDLERVEHVRRRPVILDDDAVVPLASLDGAVPANGEGRAPAVIIGDGTHRMGLIVRQILDIVEAPTSRRLPPDGLGSLGVMQVDGRAVDILDPDYHLQRISGDDGAPSVV